MIAHVPSVQDIMQSEHVSKKRAWMIRRKLSAAAHDEPVPTNQRKRVLDILQRDPSLRSSNEVASALQAEGYAIDDHDSTKVLWSLQKSGHVKFRERPHGLLYALRLTPLGQEPFDTGLPAMLVEAEASVSLDKDDEGHDITQSFPIEALPEPNVFHLDEDLYPTIRAVRDRARKAKKFAAAAAILEEIGEDDLALTLMTRTSFSPLEQEVIEMLERYDEL